MLSGFLRLIPILVLAGIAGLIGEAFLADELGWLLAVFIIVLSLFIAYVNQSRLDVFVKGAGISHLSGFGGAWAEIFFKLQRIITGLRKDIEQIERQHKRFIEAFQASPNGIVMLDDQDQIEWCNAIAEQFLSIQFKRDVLQRIHYIVRRLSLCSTLRVASTTNRSCLRRWGQIPVGFCAYRPSHSLRTGAWS